MSMRVSVSSSRKEMGQQAANDVSDTVKLLLEQKECINMIFAAAPSQSEFLQCLCRSDIDFSRVDAFYMDEYIGLAPEAPQRFTNFLKRHIFDQVSFHTVHFIDGSVCDASAEALRYEKMLRAQPIDIVCMGIGENGHIAFNDPGVCSFVDEQLVRTVTLDEKSRQQQVNDKCFDRLEEVPTHAITLTIPALLLATYHFCIVPAASKANAVHDALYGPFDESCPASALRSCPNCRMYLDEESSRMLSKLDSKG